MLDLPIILNSIALGILLFFSSVVAPIIFIRLPLGTAGKLIRYLFPFYYLAGMLITLSAAIVTFFISRVDSLVLFLLAFSFLLARQILMPQINRYRDLEMGGDIRAAICFKRLHKVSVVLNAMQILILFLVILRSTEM